MELGVTMGSDGRQKEGGSNTQVTAFIPLTPHTHTHTQEAKTNLNKQEQHVVKSKLV